MSAILKPHACNATCAAFEFLAEHTWDYLEACRQNGISVNEDAITTNNLVYLRNLKRNTFLQFDQRRREYIYGCDFEMWIGSRDAGWCGYAVQAKRMRIKGGKYPHLDHTNKQGRQIDLLDKYATHINAAPIYLFYNTAVPLSPFYCSLKKLGCTITPSSVARVAMDSGNETFAWIHAQPETSIWSRLACCPGCFGRRYQPRKMQQLPAHVRAVYEMDFNPSIEDRPLNDFGRYFRYFRPSKALIVIDTSDDPRRN